MPNFIIQLSGDEPKGMYILVSGLLEATYVPPDDDIDEAIPNYEFSTDMKFGEPSQDYIVSGNAVGVLGVRLLGSIIKMDTRGTSPSLLKHLGGIH